MDIANAPVVVETLVGEQPESIALSRRAESEGGLPAKPGFYAWWVSPGLLTGVPVTPHPLEPSLGLLYVGISPKYERSRGVIRSRVLKQHVGGNIASSTFKLDLAALLFESMNWTPRRGVKKTVLTRIDNQALRDWQETHLRLSWCIRSRPWEIEREVIRLMEPPLNLESNSEHCFYASISIARDALRAAAFRG